MIFLKELPRRGRLLSREVLELKYVPSVSRYATSTCLNFTDMMIDGPLTFRDLTSGLDLITTTAETIHSGLIICLNAKTRTMTTCLLNTKHNYSIPSPRIVSTQSSQPGWKLAFASWLVLILKFVITYSLNDDQKTILNGENYHKSLKINTKGPSASA